MAASAAIVAVVVVVVTLRELSWTTDVGLTLPNLDLSLAWLGVWPVWMALSERLFERLGVPQPERWSGDEGRRLLALRFVGMVLLAPFAEELMLLEPAVYICLLQTGNMATLADLVSSSIEPFFNEKALSFACSGGYDLSWGNSPIVSLDFEFLHGGIFAFFRMILSRAGADVELNHVSFDQTGQSPSANTELLRLALDSARLKKQAR